MSVSTACKNSFNLLLKYLTDKNSFRDEGSWFHILLALYLSSFAVICRKRDSPEKKDSSNIKLKLKTNLYSAIKSEDSEAFRRRSTYVGRLINGRDCHFLIRRLVLTAVPYKEKPSYNSKRRTAVPRVFITSPGNGIQWTRRRSTSTPHLARDPDSVSTSSGQSGYERVNQLQRPSYDSDSPYVDSGNLQYLT